MKQVIEKIMESIKAILKESGAKGTVVAVSGGVDSAVVLKLSVLSGADTLALNMPDEGVSSPNDSADAIEYAKNLGLRYHVIEINKAFDTIKKSFPWDEYDNINRKLAEANIKPRLRMMYCYLLANLDDRIVLGTGNRSELLLGYLTKHGDGASDLEPIGSLYKTRVYELANYLEIPAHFIEKKPSAGLWKGQTDESELGADYMLLDEILKLLVDEGFSPQQVARNLDTTEAFVNEINKRVKSSKHKRDKIRILSL
ncbi:MAG: NAD(+) synthetase [Candidatus Altiarchaeales archaeon ex4484_96]|nr:MAG: NAD(+) synthetase [Candidatus Altiarchaeales archaeon ex4484_96]